ncbi:MAG: AAA family ATPase, partial [Gemmatimonadales bacterium]
MSWLWPGRLPLGKLAVLEGDPGLGKSLVTLDLCARLSRGLPFPDGSAGPGPCCSLVLNAEDGEADTIRPRLAALGADLARVFVLQRQAERLSFPSQLAVL